MIIVSPFIQNLIACTYMIPTLLSIVTTFPVIASILSDYGPEHVFEISWEKGEKGLFIRPEII